LALVIRWVVNTVVNWVFDRDTVSGFNWVEISLTSLTIVRRIGIELKTILSIDLDAYLVGSVKSESITWDTLGTAILAFENFAIIYLG
jgi:hypothetical protein